MNDPLADIARSVTTAGNVEELSRALLEILERLSGLDSVYLNRVDAPRDAFEVIYARNVQPERLRIAEGMAVPWSQTLCRRALSERVRFTQAADDRWNDMPAVHELGLATYMVEPVEDADGRLLGTLCAVSARRVLVEQKVLSLFGMCARLIAHQLARDQQRQLPPAEPDATPPLVHLDRTTGLADRQSLRRELARALRQSARDGGRVRVAFVGLNLRHHLGPHATPEQRDELLATLAQRLLAATPADELVARYADDTLVVVGLLAGDFARQAAANEAFVQRVRAALTGRLDVNGTAVDFAGPRVGVVLSRPGDRPTALLEYGDAELYDYQ